jgi:hypothetical protein
MSLRISEYCDCRLMNGTPATRAAAHCASTTWLAVKLEQPR